MSRIYAHARRVITYLGPAGLEMNEQRGIRLLERVCKKIPDDIWRQMHEAGSIQQIRDWMLNGKIRSERFTLDSELAVGQRCDENEILKRYVEQGWEWLIHIGYGEWTQRLWIVQEQLLNKKTTTLRGHRLLDWDTITAIPLLFAIGYLPQQYRDMGRSNLGENSLPWDVMEETQYGIRWDRHARRQPGTSYTWSTLLQNLQWYHPLRCADPRDRVYAVLAISQDAKELNLKPDYSPLNSADALAKQVSTRILGNAVNLELLSFVCSLHRLNSTLPSWCLILDYDANIDAPDIIALGVYMAHPKVHGSCLARCHTDRSILTVKGQILDYVATSSSSSVWPLSNNSSQITESNFLSDLVYLLPGGVSIEDVTSLLRTITAKKPWVPPAGDQGSANETTAFHLWAYLRYKSRLLAIRIADMPNRAKEMLEHNDRIMRNTRSFIQSSSGSELQQPDQVTGGERVAIERVLRYALDRGRRLGRTRAGRLFNAIGTAQENDAIVALQGADKLYTVRLVGSTYKLIGDILVDGLMYGEAYENQDPDKVDYDINLA